MGRLSLHVPALDELDYREKLLADPATMAYNRGYDLDDGSYHRDTGCIDFPKTAWAEWHGWFVGNEPERFYAYIVRDADRTFIGEVNLHRSGVGGWHDIGIVLEARYRGMGYAEEALSLLLRHGFEEMGVAAVQNDFGDDRAAALSAHLACGFRVIGRERGLVTLRVSREEYLRRQAQARPEG